VTKTILNRKLRNGLKIEVNVTNISSSHNASKVVIKDEQAFALWLSEA
jgi:hypothetical protein